ncbi:YycH family regulatory protein [Piscibacillus halophilus]|uniref:Two-component signal transduction system YycFG, regulatory protein YycH n=1 Tax=Piscibacillus halophilus TaxID=571933 RepID=A0A1H9CYI2_9BACI|nr:two-component system activity regulator YycH [Piscibacillus halophilus]SEQ06234.1 Two-component signal transduction system YycFG, regulatory protein YycH [Piscibacillus halophilus]
MIEQIKSVVLFLLVASSLLLTYALWTYQPDFEPIEQTEYITQSKLDGEEKSVREVVFPNQIIIHDYQTHKRLESKQDEKDFYEEFLNWDFSSLTIPTSNHYVLEQYMQQTELEQWESKNQYQSIEIQYPVSIPMDMINYMYSVNTENQNYSQSFNKVFLHLQDSTKEIKVAFVSDEEGESDVLVGEIQSSSAYQRLEELINQQDDMVYLKGFEFKEGQTIYLPTEEIAMNGYTLLTESFDAATMVNALFRDPSVVRQTLTNAPNVRTHYTDGSRALKTYQILNNEAEQMEFINPLSNDLEQSNPTEMIRRSVNLTNVHLGWTNDYQLDEIQKQPSSAVLYRMYYDGYPVYHDKGVTTMEQVWGNNELNKLKRPLFKLIEDEAISVKENVLPSGDSIYQTIESLSERITLNSIEQVKLGYTLKAKTSPSSQVITLEPEWYIKLEGSWQPMSQFNDMLMNQGVE